MKKFATIATLGLSCALAFSLAACGGDPAPEESPSNKAPDPDNIKSEQVSETEWKSAFDFSEVTNVTFKRTNLVTTLGKTDETYALAMFDGNKIYNEELKYTANGGSTTPQKTTVKEYYSISADDIYIYEYNSTDKKWEKEATGWYPTIEYYLNEVDGIVNAYKSFKYDSSKSAYVSTELTGSGFDYISVKITDGKAAVVQMDADRSHGVGSAYQSMIYQAYDIGKTNVSLPKIKDDSSESGWGSDIGGSSQVTKEGWDRAISEQAFYNVTIDVTTKEGKQTRKTTLSYDYSTGCVLSEGDDGYTTLYAYIDNGKWWFTKEDEKWRLVHFDPESRDTIESDIQQRVTSFLSAFNYGDSFEYKDGEYTAKNYTVKGMNDYVCDYVTLAFEKGKLVKCEFSMPYEKTTMSMKMIFSDYNATSVKFPTDFEEDGNGGSGDNGGNGGSVSIGIKQWDAAFKPESFYNCIVVDRIEDENGVAAVYNETWMDYNNRRAHLITDIGSLSYDYIIAEVGGSYYMYLYNGSDYTKHETSAADLDKIYSNNFANFEMFVGDFDKFNYDEKTQSFVAHKYTLAALENKIADEVRIHFVDGRVDSVVLIITEDGTTYTEYWYVTNYNATVIEVPVLKK